ncbi:MAG: hypothetical protein RL033_3702 [Pseudomonadota bacterium]
MALLAGFACGNHKQEATGPTDGTEAPPGEKLAEVPHVAVRDEGRQGEPVLTVVDGANGEKEEHWIPAEQALADGATLIDFSDDWTPYLFEEQRDAAGQLLPNRYRRVFMGLANDQLDGDGEPLEPGEKNYLELYGIFPSFSVLRARFLEDETRTCDDPEGVLALAAVKAVAFPAIAVQRRDAARQPKIGRELEGERARAGVATLAELAVRKPTLAAKVKEFERWQSAGKAVEAAERRLICEGFLKAPDPTNKSKAKHQPGMQDPPFSTALRHFQQKHMIYEGHALRPRTLEALARPPLANDHAGMLRALRERVVAASDVLEDGSTDTKSGPPTYLNKAGERVAMRNLAEEYTNAAALQLGLDTPERALTFFKRRDQAVPGTAGAKGFQRLRGAVKLAPRPEYYSQHMELSIVIDRGDVWYDPPFDDKDKWRWPSRQRYPNLSLYADYQGQKLPLARWRTTIGGWRAEQASNGYEYYKYKGSDVGARVLRKISSGPVWIAPETEPIRALVKGRKVQGRWQSGVNYDALGPGYLSAYGVVAGYFVIPGQGDAPDIDRGIRAHGSSDYLSMYSANGYSHGCHRLPNHLAIRLYDFILQHRHTNVKGDSPMDFSRQFLFQDHVYDMRIPSRGFEFELDPPMAVTTLEGTIKGTIKQPIEGLVPKPGVRYPPTIAPPEEIDTVSTATQRVRAAVDKGTP